ncbi:MAG: O-antigen ligase family protein, partial [Bacteroidetes bacterium]|nr:O-antigen ligase family protein [Bacteroidota bacterium]
MKIVTGRYKNHIILVLSVFYLALNLYLIINDFYGLLLIPIFIIIVSLYLLSSDAILLLITALTPLSISFEVADTGLLLSLPTEILLIGITVLFILKFVYDNSYDKRILMHPISILVGLSLLWMLICSITSETPVVSFKYLISRMWFVIPFYFMAVMLFKRKELLKFFSWLYVIPLIIVIIYSIFRHAQFGFSEETGHWVMSPFFNDHTSYGAMLAFFIPVFIGFNRIVEYSKTVRRVSFLVSIILILALVLSFSRAAWLSLAIVFFIFLCIRWKIKFKWIAISSSVLIIFFFFFQKEIIQQLEKNTTESSGNYVAHIKSIYNISSDASNLERINRWQSAIRMFKERPIVGWGPGSYQFVYAP